MSFDVRQLTKAISNLIDPAGPLTQAIVRALNRSMGSGETVMVRSISADVGLTQRVVRAQIILDPATAATLTARLSVTGKRIPLIEFGVSGREPSRGRGAGVRSRMKGGAGQYPHAFIATMPSGHRGVFERTPGKYMRAQKPTWTQKRQAIHELLGPSLPKIFGKFRPQALARAEEQLKKNLPSELNFALRAANRAAA